MPYYLISKPGELAHYGILGQKWGIRRFQNPDGTLTAEGQKRYGSVKEMKKDARREYRRDQRMAKDYGNEAATSAYAYQKQLKTYEKAKKRFDKNPTEKRLRKLNIEAIASQTLKNIKNNTQNKAEEHYKLLVDKYGKQAVKDIKYDKNGMINEKNGSTTLNILSAVLGAAASIATGFAVVPVFSSNKEQGRQLRSVVRANTKYSYEQAVGSKPTEIERKTVELKRKQNSK